MRLIRIILPALILVLSCQKTGNIEIFDNMEVTSLFIPEVPFIISNGDCAGDSRTHTYLCLDSVLNDSRCPTGAYCFWAGDAEARFKYSSSGEKSVTFILHPNGSTIINGYNFTLKALTPYPSTSHHPLQEEYKAEMLVEKI